MSFESTWEDTWTHTNARCYRSNTREVRDRAKEKHLSLSLSFSWYAKTFRTAFIRSFSFVRPLRFSKSNLVSGTTEKNVFHSFALFSSTNLPPLPPRHLSLQSFWLTLSRQGSQILRKWAIQARIDTIRNQLWNLFLTLFFLFLFLFLVLSLIGWSASFFLFITHRMSNWALVVAVIECD